MKLNAPVRPHALTPPKSNIGETTSENTTEVEVAANSAEEASEQPPVEKKDASTLTSPPNNRHHWDPDRAKWVRRLRDVAIPLIFRLDDQGFDKIPKGETVIVGPTHQSFFDALIASRVPEEPHGSMSDVNQFKGTLGQLLADYGSFPVDRWGEYEGDFPHPVDHAVEILNDGSNFIFYPEGRIYDDETVYPLKTGIGRISMNSSVDYALPVAQHYSKDTEFHAGETAVGVVLSGVATAAGIWASSQGPVARAIAGTLTGAVGGMVLGGAAGFAAGPKDNAGKRALKAAKWGAAFAGASAVTSAVVSAVAPGAAKYVIGAGSVLTGLAGLGFTYHWTHRTIAHTHVGDPIAVEPYRQRAAASDDPNAVWNEGLQLTADFHEALATTKEKLTGVESPFRMTETGDWEGRQEDGTWKRVERNEDKEWVAVD